MARHSPSRCRQARPLNRPDVLLFPNVYLPFTGVELALTSLRYAGVEMKRWLGSIARKAGEWRDRYRPVIVAFLLGSGLTDASKDGKSPQVRRK